jgi:phage terminase large subunit-like protein
MPSSTESSLLTEAAMLFGARGLHDAMTPQQRLMARYSYELQARPLGRLPTGEYTGQMEPPGNWRTWLCMPGRGWGKTWTLNQWVRRKAKKHPGCRIAIIGATASEARKITGKGDSGLVNICPPWERPHFNVTDQCYEFPNGSLAFLYSADKPDLFRGPQFHFVASDELAKWRRLSECIYNIQFGLRLPVRGGRAQWMIATTPRPLQTLRDIKNKPTTVTTVGSSFENASSLDPDTLAEWLAWKDTAIGRQELGGELFDQAEGAVYERRWIRFCKPEDVPPLDRIGVGVDPAETDGKASDDTGIIVAGSVGTGIRARAWVLDDRTCHKSPDAAAREVVKAYVDHHASFIKVDGGRNGQAFCSLIKMAAQLMGVTVNVLPPKGGNAGKRAWASPVAGVYEQGRVTHVVRPLFDPERPISSDVPVLRELEEQMCTWTEEKQEMGECGSPDRMDAASYVLTELLIRSAPSIRGLNDSRSTTRRM